MKCFGAGCIAALTIATPAKPDISFSGYGWFGASFDDATGKAETTSRLRFTIDGETEAANGMELSFRIRVQAENGEQAKFNGARFGLRYGPLRLRVGNISGAIDALPSFYGAEPGLTDLTNQTAALRADFDVYDNEGPGRNGVSVRYSKGAFEALVSHSNLDGISRTAAYAALSSGPSTLALGYQASNIQADDGLAVLIYRHKFDLGSVSLLAAREQAGQVVGASASWDITAATALQASASIATDNTTERHFGLGLTHELGGDVSLEAGIAWEKGTRKADIGVRFEF